MKMTKSLICPKCGSANTNTGSTHYASDKIRFCFNCGTDMSSDTLGASTITTEAPTLALETEAAAFKRREQDALVGRTLDGKYLIGARLGAGGMGTVYKGTRLHIGDTVAIKILHRDTISDIHAAERFRREAQATSRLKHPNAVSIYDFGITEDSLAYIVMELVEGKSLRSIIKRRGPLSPLTVDEILGQVCDALDEAHRTNMVHRDIKPDNIIVNTSPSGLRVKVLDFGIAKLHNVSSEIINLTATGSVMGTPQYMSPEQCMDEELDGRSDVYSLGIVLYEALTGRVPFTSTTATAVAVAQVNQKVPPLRALNPTISPVLEAVVMHALEKRREARPQTAGALAQEWHAAMSGVPTATSTSVRVTNQHELIATIMAPATPLFGTGAVESGPMPSFPSGIDTSSFPSQINTPPFLRAATASKSRRDLVPLIVGIAVAFGLLAAGAVGLLIWLYLWPSGPR
jgi:serine/threonine protein kinase